MSENCKPTEELVVETVWEDLLEIRAACYNSLSNEDRKIHVRCKCGGTVFYMENTDWPMCQYECLACGKRWKVHEIEKNHSSILKHLTTTLIGSSESTWPEKFTTGSYGSHAYYCTRPQSQEEIWARQAHDLLDPVRAKHRR